MSGLKEYEYGLKDAWMAAREISGNDGFDYEELIGIFGTADLGRIFSENSASEAIKKIGDYKASKSRIGNIVRLKAGSTKEVGVITSISKDYKRCVVMLKDGDFKNLSLDDVIKIGHMDMINDIIKSLNSMEAP